MLSDRTYLRFASGRPGPGFLVSFLGVLAGLFVLQKVMEVFFDSFLLLDFGALSAGDFRRGEVWTPLTYALLHGNVLHLLLNGLALVFIGRHLEELLGPRRLAQLVIAGSLGGALAWLGLHFHGGGTVIGASAVAMSFLAVFACIYPRRPITVLLFFILPMTIQPIWLVTIIAGIDVLGLLTQELPGSGALYGVAHSAHLGGLAAGWLFHRFVLGGGSDAVEPLVEPPDWSLKRRGPASAPGYTVDLGPSHSPTPVAVDARPAPATGTTSPRGSIDALRAEVDRILDKISLHGFGSLTDAEKRVLDEARQQFSHR